MSTPATDEDRQLKARHRKMWGLGDYPAMVTDFLLPLGERLVDAAAIKAGDRVLDVASGTGNAAIVAAQKGADVVASDLTPELFDAGRERAAELGVELEWAEADAEALPFADGEFDVVMSSIGAMFAPHHEATAAELVRVCRPGGTIAMINWTPEGIIGDVFRAMGPYMPTPPPGATPPPKWGSEDHVRELLGDAVSDLHMGRDVLNVDFLATPQEYRDYFRSHYGPTIVAFANNADDPERSAALEAELGDVFDRRAPGRGPARYDFEYLVVVARKA